ncbi:MAG: shikimate dehydrogenase [Lachnospiraceae bacterium]
MITGHTRLLGLLGTPVSHSISPMMHNASFQYHNLDYIYLCFDSDETQLENSIAAMKRLNARGWNCTMPVKNRMYELSDKLSPAASIIGAVNTVVNDNGVLTGHNTDGVGYMMAVKDAGHDIIGKKMTLFGAGGAATAILVQAALDGVREISVFSIRDRFFSRAEQIVSHLNAETNCKVTLYDFSDDNVLRREIAASDILTNATSVGMAPHVERCILSDPSYFHQNLIVSDVIYNPQKTKLLTMAEEAGCPTFNGMYMLLYQGAEAFQLWTGKEMPIELIKQQYFQK